MANTISSPNMTLPIPIVGVDPGPQYASDVNSCLTLIDQHNHAPGFGVPIGADGLNIQSDLSLNSQNLISARSLRLAAQSSVAGASDLRCLYSIGNDLYFNDGITNVIRITQSGGVAGTPGSIANLTSPASASYVAANQTFVFQSDASTAANLDVASILMRNTSVSSHSVTLSPPSAMGSDTTITLPTLPASTLPVSISAGGQMSAAPITLAQLIAAVQQSLNPAGAIVAYGGGAAPAGYLLCDGSAVSRASFAALFSAIGTAYGVGDGSTTFNLPDARGQFLRGVTGASGNDPDAASRTATNGGNAGNLVGSSQADSFAAHTHAAINVAVPAPASGGFFNFSVTVPSGTPDRVSMPTTASGGLETRPKNIYVNYIIKT